MTVTMSIVTAILLPVVIFFITPILFLNKLVIVCGVVLLCYNSNRGFKRSLRGLIIISVLSNFHSSTHRVA